MLNMMCTGVFMIICVCIVDKTNIQGMLVWIGWPLQGCWTVMWNHVDGESNRI